MLQQHIFHMIPYYTIAYYKKINSQPCHPMVKKLIMCEWGETFESSIFPSISLGLDKVFKTVLL